MTHEAKVGGKTLFQTDGIALLIELSTGYCLNHRCDIELRQIEPVNMRFATMYYSLEKAKEDVRQGRWLSDRSMSKAQAKR